MIATFGLRISDLMRLTVLVLVLPLGATAQQTESETHGSVTTGYRFTDIAGRKEKFTEFFGLRDGFRVHDFTLWGNAPRENRFFDSYSMTSSGIGGEPFAGGQLKVSKDGMYDLRVNYRQSYYYWDRNDIAAHPTGLQGLTTNHDWTTVRRFGSLNLAMYATDNLRFNLEYHRSARDGMTLTTRTLEYFGAPSTWAGFLRANPYVVQAPLNEVANRLTGGVSYTRSGWNFFYRSGYQTYEESLVTDNLVSGQRSINTDEAATANEPLNDASWSEFRRLKTPLSEFSYNGSVSSRVRVRGGYMFYRYHGPASLNAAFTGTARTTSAAAVAPYAVSLTNRADVTEPNHIIDQGFTVEINDKLHFHTDYRYSRFAIDSHARFESVQNPSTLAAGETEIEWREGMHNLEAALEIAPMRDLMIRPGIRMMKRDVTVLDDGVADPVASRPSKLASPILSVYYSPAQRFSLRADIQNTTNGGPYTRISPRTDFNSRLITRFEPVQNVTIENNLRLRNAAYTTTSFKNTIRSNTTTVRYSPSDQLALYGTFTYDSFLATAAITFLRGTPPLTATWRDQTINRIWQAGIEARPVSSLSFNISGSYDRTTGAGEISGEPPAFGPLRWPLVSGTVSYDFPNVGRLSIDLQRTYYIEEIMRGDNFSANLLGIRWTREF